MSVRRLEVWYIKIIENTLIPTTKVDPGDHFCSLRPVPKPGEIPHDFASYCRSPAAAGANGVEPGPLCLQFLLPSATPPSGDDWHDGNVGTKLYANSYLWVAFRITLASGSIEVFAISIIWFCRIYTVFHTMQEVSELPHFCISWWCQALLIQCRQHPA